MSKQRNYFSLFKSESAEGQLVAAVGVATAALLAILMFQRFGPSIGSLTGSSLYRSVSCAAGDCSAPVSAGMVAGPNGIETPIDLDGDGNPDVIAVDIDGDGRIDAFNPLDGNDATGFSIAEEDILDEYDNIIGRNTLINGIPAAELAFTPDGIAEILRLNGIDPSTATLGQLAALIDRFEGAEVNRLANGFITSIGLDIDGDGVIDRTVAARNLAELLAANGVDPNALSLTAAGELDAITDAAAAITGPDGRIIGYALDLDGDGLVDTTVAPNGILDFLTANGLDPNTVLNDFAVLSALTDLYNIPGLAILQQNGEDYLAAVDLDGDGNVDVSVGNPDLFATTESGVTWQPDAVYDYADYLAENGFSPALQDIFSREWRNSFRFTDANEDGVIDFVTVLDANGNELFVNPARGNGFDFRDGGIVYVDTDGDGVAETMFRNEIDAGDLAKELSKGKLKFDEARQCDNQFRCTWDYGLNFGTGGQDVQLFTRRQGDIPDWQILDENGFANLVQARIAQDKDLRYASDLFDRYKAANANLDAQFAALNEDQINDLYRAAPRDKWGVYEEGRGREGRTFERFDADVVARRTLAVNNILAGLTPDQIADLAANAPMRFAGEYVWRAGEGRNFERYRTDEIVRNLLYDIARYADGTARNPYGDYQALMQVVNAHEDVRFFDWEEDQYCRGSEGCNSSYYGRERDDILGTLAASNGAAGFQQEIAEDLERGPSKKKSRGPWGFIKQAIGVVLDITTGWGGTAWRAVTGLIEGKSIGSVLTGAVTDFAFKGLGKLTGGISNDFLRSAVNQVGREGISVLSDGKFDIANVGLGIAGDSLGSFVNTEFGVDKSLANSIGSNVVNTAAGRQDVVDGLVNVGFTAAGNAASNALTSDRQNALKEAAASGALTPEATQNAQQQIDKLNQAVNGVFGAGAGLVNGNLTFADFGAQLVGGAVGYGIVDSQLNNELNVLVPEPEPVPTNLTVNGIGGSQLGGEEADPLQQAFGSLVLGDPEAPLLVASSDTLTVGAQRGSLTVIDRQRVNGYVVYTIQDKNGVREQVTINPKTGAFVEVRLLDGQSGKRAVLNSSPGKGNASLSPEVRSRMSNTVNRTRQLSEFLQKDAKSYGTLSPIEQEFADAPREIGRQMSQRGMNATSAEIETAIAAQRSAFPKLPPSIIKQRALEQLVERNILRNTPAPAPAPSRPSAVPDPSDPVVAQPPVPATPPQTIEEQIGIDKIGADIPSGDENRVEGYGGPFRTDTSTPLPSMDDIDNFEEWMVTANPQLYVQQPGDSRTTAFLGQAGNGLVTGLAGTGKGLVTLGFLGPYRLLAEGPGPIVDSFREQPRESAEIVGGAMIEAAIPGPISPFTLADAAGSCLRGNCGYGAGLVLADVVGDATTGAVANGLTGGGKAPAASADSPAVRVRTQVDTGNGRFVDVNPDGTLAPDPSAIGPASSGQSPSGGGPIVASPAGEIVPYQPRNTAPVDDAIDVTWEYTRDPLGLPGFEPAGSLPPAPGWQATVGAGPFSVSLTKDPVTGNYCLGCAFTGVAGTNGTGVFTNIPNPKPYFTFNSKVTDSPTLGFDAKFFSLLRGGGFEQSTTLNNDGISTSYKTPKDPVDLNTFDSRNSQGIADLNRYTSPLGLVGVQGAYTGEIPTAVVNGVQKAIIEGDAIVQLNTTDPVNLPFELNPPAEVRPFEGTEPTLRLPANPGPVSDGIPGSLLNPEDLTLTGDYVAPNQNALPPASTERVDLDGTSNKPPRQIDYDYIDNPSPDDFNDCSFSAETLVTTANGLVPIANVTRGTYVLAMHETDLTLGFYPVRAVFSSIDVELLDLTIGDETITTTPNHRFYSDGEWIAAGDLDIGSFVTGTDLQPDVITAINPIQRTERMYNMTVDEAHTYFVGEQGWLVHNANCNFVGTKLSDAGTELQDRGYVVPSGNNSQIPAPAGTSLPNLEVNGNGVIENATTNQFVTKPLDATTRQQIQDTGAYIIYSRNGETTIRRRAGAGGNGWPQLQVDSSGNINYATSSPRVNLVTEDPLLRSVRVEETIVPRPITLGDPVPDAPGLRYESPSTLGQPVEFGTATANTVYRRGGTSNDSYEFVTDGFGRVDKVFVDDLEYGTGVRTSEQTFIGRAGNRLDEGGHLIGNQFLGSDDIGIVPQDWRINRGPGSLWTQMENDWAAAKQAGSKVEVQMELDYSVNNSIRPDSIRVDYMIDGVPYTRVFDNNAASGAIIPND